MPTFCRHNRFLERCPICSKTLPGASAGGRSPRGATSTRDPSARRAAAPRRPRGEGVRVHREGRAQDDGYRSSLLPGVRASADAARLSEEIAFANGRLLALAAAPWGLYAEARKLAEDDLRQASWTCFLISYLSPLDSPPDGADPFAGIRLALERELRAPEELDGIPLGPRTSHDPARGVETLFAYRHWVQSADSEAGAFIGDPDWSPTRRFERLFERLALPGFGRTGRYELLVTLGRLGLYELRADSLHLLGALSSSDLTTLGAKRLFAIGDPIHLERRAAALAKEIAVPVETLDLALANWASPQRATLGIDADVSDHEALLRARGALGL
jgi:Alpha-glutamyl/putrescinyl thymine pyrophosphorylase clade 3